MLRRSTPDVYCRTLSNSQVSLRQIQQRLDGLEDAIEILADKRTLASIKKALSDIKNGRYKDYRNVKQFRAEFESKV